MNYRHSFHAGNSADVVKHSLLIALVQALQQKPGALTLIDTHAGCGLYDLGGDQAQRTGEATHGVLRAFADTNPLLDEYRAAVQAVNDGMSDGAEPRLYPGSPRILEQVLRPADADLVQRLSATEIERIVAEAIRRWYLRVDDPFGVIRSAHLSDRGLQLTLDTEHCSNIITRLAENEVILDRTADSVTICLPIIFPPRGGRHLVVPSLLRPLQPDRVLIAALRKAHAMLSTERGLPTIGAAPTSPYDRGILRLAFLAPDIQQAILDGRQPHHLNLEALKSIELPLSWSQQRDVLRFRR